MLYVATKNYYLKATARTDDLKDHFIVSYHRCTSELIINLNFIDVINPA